MESSSRLHLPRLQRPNARQPEEYPEVQRPGPRGHRRNRGVSMAHRIKSFVGIFTAGWATSSCAIKSFFSEMDKWVRRRLRLLLEAMASPTHPNRQFEEAWHPRARGITHGISSKGRGSCPPVKPCIKHSRWTISRRRTGESIRYLEQAHCTETNRLVRTRMLGGVGGVPSNPAPIPIMVLWLCCVWRSNF